MLAKLAKHYLPATVLLGDVVVECDIKATNDFEAIQSWLNEFKYKQNTYSSYRCEVTKFLVWCNYESKLKFMELKKEDFENYIAWLKSPQKRWIKAKDNNSDLQPFKGPQSFAGITYNIRVINSLLNYLVEADYICKNPLRLIKQFSKFKELEDRKLKVKSRILEDNEFQAVLDLLEELSEETKSARDYKVQTKLIFALLYHLGLRVSELSNATWSNFKMVQGRCWYFLIGKGDKPGQIPVNNELLEIVKKYRKYIGLAIDVASFESDYVLKSKKTGFNLSSRRIREIVKEIFMLAATKFTDQTVQEKLKAASPHDLRHLLASDLDKIGVSIIDTKEILRHSSEKTTEIYRNSKERVRHDAIQKNIIGMKDLLTVNIKNHTEIKIIIECRSQDVLSFNYFISAIKNIYFKEYELLEELDIDKLQLRFKKLSRLCSDMAIKLLINKQLADDEVVYLRRAITKAANIRGIGAKLIEVGSNV